jgi:branched-chain amino acid transport system ATP-binding protein
VGRLDDGAGARRGRRTGAKRRREDDAVAHHRRPACEVGGRDLGDAPIRGLRADAIALRGVALLREGGRLPGSLSVHENLQLGQRLARLRGRAGRTLEEVWRWFPILEPLRERKAALLSGGQRQALALACAFIAEPSILLLDEPSAGLAPPVARDLFATIRQLATSGVTVLVVEQQPAWLIGLAQYCYLLEVGRVVDEGPIETLLASAGGRMM